MAYNSVRNSAISFFSKHTRTVYKTEASRLDRLLFSILCFFCYSDELKKNYYPSHDGRIF